jgi:P27 family predicted phage terminase small subunit
MSKKKSISLHKLHGTFQHSRHTAPNPVVSDVDTADDTQAPPRSLPAPVVKLGKVARKEWRRVSSLGEIDEADLGGLAAYCVAFQNWQQAQAIIEKEGPVINVPIVSKNTGEIIAYSCKRHPATIIAKDERQAMLQAAARIGLFLSDEEEE